MEGGGGGGLPDRVSVCFFFLPLVLSTVDRKLDLKKKNASETIKSVLRPLAKTKLWSSVLNFSGTFKCLNAVFMGQWMFDLFRLCLLNPPFVPGQFLEVRTGELKS